MSSTFAPFGDARFWDLIFETAQSAVGGVVSHDVAVGPCRMRLRLAGPALVERLLPGLELLREAPSDDSPQLTVHLWDSYSTGIKLDSVFRAADGGGGKSTVAEQMHVSYDPETQVVRAVSADRRKAWWVVPDARRLHYYSRSAPLRDFIHIALRHTGMPMLHAGAVGLPDGGVLLIGPGGSGKSTATLACLGSELGILSEDYTAVEPGLVPKAWGIYSTAKFNDDTRRWVPLLEDYIVNPTHSPPEKNLVYLHRVQPVQMLREMPLRGVFVVGRSPSQETYIVPASRGETLRALAPSTLLQLRGAGEKFHPEESGLTDQAQLLRQLPCHRILTGSNLPSIPNAILKFLRSQ